MSPPLRMVFAEGWASPMVFDQDNGSTVVMSGSDTLVGLLVETDLDEVEVAMQHMHPGSLTWAVSATLLDQAPVNGQ